MAQFEAEKKKFEEERKKQGKGGAVHKLDAEDAVSTNGQAELMRCAQVEGHCKNVRAA